MTRMNWYLPSAKKTAVFRHISSGPGLRYWHQLCLMSDPVVTGRVGACPTRDQQQGTDPVSPGVAVPRGCTGHMPGCQASSGCISSIPRHGVGESANGGDRLSFVRFRTVSSVVSRDVRHAPPPPPPPAGSVAERFVSTRPVAAAEPTETGDLATLVMFICRRRSEAACWPCQL